MLTTGGVRSTLMFDTTAGPPTSPALFVHVPEAFWLMPSDRTIGEAQLNTPETPSAPVNLTVTAVLRHPAEFGPGFADAVTLGAVASLLIVMEADAVPEALVAVQVNVRPLVSDVIVRAAQPDCEVILVAEVTVQVRDTSLVYQPLLPRVPPTTGVIRGALATTE
jgi:hypothetical protein